MINSVATFIKKETLLKLNPAHILSSIDLEVTSEKDLLNSLIQEPHQDNCDPKQNAETFPDVDIAQSLIPVCEFVVTLGAFREG